MDAHVPAAPPRRRSWTSISLRTLLLIMLGCGCILGMIGRESRQAKRRAELVQDLSKAASKIDIVYVDVWGRETGAPPPKWQAAVLGEPYFQHVTGVVIEDPDQLRDANMLAGLRHLTTFRFQPREWRIVTASSFVEFRQASFRDAHALGLRPLRNLEKVSLPFADIGDSGVACLSPENPLRSLELVNTLITDRGLAHLGRFQTLELLDLSNTWITDAGIDRIARLPNLKLLRLCNVMVSDKGLQSLSHSPSLESITLGRLAITSRGVAQLARLPNLKSVQVDARSLAPDQVHALSANSRSDAPLISPPSPFWALKSAHGPKGARYLRWLLEHGANPNEPQGIGGIAPLAAYAVENDRESVEVLLAHGAVVNQSDDGGRTPLSMAAEHGQLEMMKLLLDRGADPHPRGGQSAVCSAAACGQNAAIELLSSRGADLNRPNHTGETPLYVAAAQPDTIALLRMLGADPAARRRNMSFGSNWLRPGPQSQSLLRA